MTYIQKGPKSAIIEKERVLKEGQVGSITINFLSEFKGFYGSAISGTVNIPSLSPDDIEEMGGEDVTMALYKYAIGKPK